MQHVTFAEYQKAKNEIICGIEYKEESIFPNQWGMMSKTYSTESNGNFYEVTDPKTGVTEFWSDKHPASRYYDPRTSADTTAKPEADTATATELPAYGKMLAEKIRAETTNFSKVTDFEKFILDRGWAFKTEETLRAGYDRHWKCARGILLTEDEFTAEAGLGINTFSQWNEEAAREVYNVLAGFVKAGKLTAAEVYRYAHYKWCLRKPEAIVAYQEGRDKWIVNNCDTEVSEDEAKIAVNSEWGFEVSRIHIIGKAYYDATDYQFIRFDCAHMTWLWKNGNLYQVYA